MKRIALSTIAVCAIALMTSTAFAGEVRPSSPQPDRSEIDLVIALDTSNSMDGLIDSARQKMWDIVSELATAKPTPVLRVGIVSFGNDGYQQSGWTRVDQDLTDDLDAVFEKLMALRTNGGTEYVGRSIHVARTQMHWRKNPKALKLMFVAGNESADQDREFRALDEAGKIIAEGVIVNTIYCGQENHPDAIGWRNVAARADGKFAAISADGGAIVVATPYDDQILKLNEKLNRTYIGYGSLGKKRKARQERADKAAASVSRPAAVARSGAKATRLYNNRSWDLVDAAQEDDFKVSGLAARELPEEMQAMNDKERQAYIKKKAAERKKIQSKLTSLNKKRQTFIKKKLARKGNDKNKAFDDALSRTLKQQAAEKGINF